MPVHQLGAPSSNEQTQLSQIIRFAHSLFSKLPFRDDNAIVYRLIKRRSYTTPVSLRGGSVSEGRGNPSCLEGRVRRVRSVY
jgi:hypothetical protein